MLPKAERASDFAAMQEAVAGKPLHALVETVSAILNLADLVIAPGLARLSFGTVDFQADAGIDWATRVSFAIDGAFRAAAVDGKLIDKPDVDHARRLLENHAAFQAG